MNPIQTPRPSALHPRSSSLPKVLEYLQFRLALQHSIRIRITRPSERTPIPKCFVPPRQSRINDIFTITDDSDEPPVRRVAKISCKDFGCAHFFDGEGYPVSICNRNFLDGLDVGGEDFIVAGIDEFSGRVHTVCGLVPPELRSTNQIGLLNRIGSVIYLDNDRTLVITHSDFIDTFAQRDTPSTFERITEGIL